MRRRRARLCAAAIVATVALVSIAHASFMITQNPAGTEPGPLLTPLRILVSLRNPTAVPQSVTMISRSPTGNANCPLSVQVMALDPDPIPPYSQAQFMIFSNGFSVSDPMPSTCVWDVFSSEPSIQQFTTVFSIMPTSTVAWDLQPKVTDFGSQSETGDSETQKILINNYLLGIGTFDEMVIADPTGSIRFVTDCPNLQSCLGTFTVGTKASRFVEIACDPTGAIPITGTFTIYSAGTPLASTSLMCQGVSGGGIDMHGNTPNRDVAFRLPGRVKVPAPLVRTCPYRA